MLGIILLTILALIISILLVCLDNEEKNNKKEYLKRLPGFNCGACGYGSCEGMAEAMCEQIESYKKCKPLRGSKLEEMENYINNM